MVQKQKRKVCPPARASLASTSVSSSISSSMKILVLRTLSFIVGSVAFGLHAQDTQIRLLVKDVRQLTFQGSNAQSFLSPDGAELIYVSERRKTHLQKEAYLYEVKSQKERRLTFQLGVISEPQVQGPDVIYYTGSSDEEQDFNSLTLDPGPLPRSEVYRSDSRGREIKRLTESPGYDGQWTESKELAPWSFYVRWSAGQSQLMQVRVNEPPVAIVTDPKSVITLLRSDGSVLYWQEEARDSGAVSVFSLNVGTKGAQLKSKKLLFTAKGKLQRLTPINGGEFFVAGLETKFPEDNLVTLINPREKCAYALINLFDPVFFGHARWIEGDRKSVV